MILETERLILRHFNQNDLEDFYEYAKVEGVGEMAGWRHHQSIEESQQILERFINDKDEETFAIVWKENGKVIGSISIDAQDYDEMAPGKIQRTIGYVLNKDYWGRGIMPEAVRQILRYAFEELDTDTVLVAHFTHNKQSQRVIEKIGFTYFRDVKIHSNALNQTFPSKKYFYTREMYTKWVEEEKNGRQ